ncbi:MAG: (Fe-S)-binding protein [Anaerolineales bacterium]
MLFGVVRRGNPDIELDGLPLRIWRSLVILISQRPVWRTRPVTGILHALIVWGFLYYLLVNVGDLMYGFIPRIQYKGTGLLSGLYRLGADIVTLFILISVIYFFARRFVVRSRKLDFAPNVMLQSGVKTRIRNDSLVVYLFILLHVGFRIASVSAGIALHGQDVWQPFASMLSIKLTHFSLDTLIALEHIGWWISIGSILVFIPYFPLSKHIHLIAAPINHLLKPKRTSLGALPPIDFEDEDIQELGVQRIEQLGQSQLIDAFACIMCNRCQDVCPAYVTGKDLSPAALEVNKRHMINIDMAAIAAGESTEPLLDNAISSSALWACTTCGACIDICPVGNEPMFDIVDLRRYQVLTTGEFPNSLQNAFNGMERQGNPWQANEDRMAWCAGLNVPTVEDNPNFEYLYWVGCAATYDPIAKEVARSFIKILNAANVNYAVLGDRECCTGDTARRSGHEYLFFEMASQNIDTLSSVSARKIIVTCPHCLHSLGAEYVQFGCDFEVIHHTTLISELISSGMLDMSMKNEEYKTITFHDPCYLGRHNGIFDDPRSVLESGGVQLTEMPRNKQDSFCCGAGGGQMWKEEEPGRESVSAERLAEAKSTGADVIAVACPFCRVMMNDANRTDGETIQIKDVAEIVADSIAD